LIVWDGNTGNVVRTIIDNGATDLKAIDLSTDGERLVTTNGNGARIWDTGKGELVRSISNDNSGRKHSEPDVSSLYTDHVWSVQLSPDGRQLSMGDTLGVKLFDTLSGKLLLQVEGPYHYSSSASPRLVFSPDGEQLARMGTQEKIDGDQHRYVVPIWSTRTRAKQVVLHTEANDAAFSDDGQCLVVGLSDMQQALSVWALDADEQKTSRTLGPGPHSRVDRVEENGHYVGRKAAELIEQFQPTWGESRLGLQYGIALTRPGRPFRSGERVPLVVFFRTTSDQPIKFNTAPDFFGNPPQGIQRPG
jgi:WD40 repeat protein